MLEAFEKARTERRALRVMAEAGFDTFAVLVAGDDGAGYMVDHYLKVAFVNGNLYTWNAATAEELPFPSPITFAFMASRSTELVSADLVDVDSSSS